MDIRQNIAFTDPLSDKGMTIFEGVRPPSPCLCPECDCLHSDGLAVVLVRKHARDPWGRPQSQISYVHKGTCLIRHIGADIESELRARKWL